MTFPDKIKEYIGEKIGYEYLEGFCLWSIVGRNPSKHVNESFIDSWNMAHPHKNLRRSMNAFDAVDRMIEIWRERFK